MKNKELFSRGIRIVEGRSLPTMASEGSWGRLLLKIEKIQRINEEIDKNNVKMSIYKSNYWCKRSDVDNTVSLDIVLENRMA